MELEVDPDMEMGMWLKMQDPSWGVYADNFNEEMGMDCVEDLKMVETLNELRCCDVREEDLARLWERIEAVKRKLP